MTSSLDRRQFIKGAAAFSTAALLPASPALARRRRAAVADLVIVNGRVLTMDGRFRIAEALAVRDGKVMAVGRTRDIRRLAGRRTAVLDAGRGTVMPGINDSHLHLNSYGLSLPPTTINVDTATIPELVAEVRRAVEAAGRGDAWIRGTGWNENRLPQAPTRHDLDPISGDHPVILTSFDGHAVAVNTKALQLAGVTRDTVPPPGGVIEKDASGEPTGVLREGAAGLVRRIVPPFTDAEVRRSLRAGAELLAATGVTSVTDPGINLRSLRLMAELSRAGRLPMRVNALLSAGNSVATLRKMLADYRPLRRVDERMLRVAGIKIFADGIPTAAKTAWLKQPYLDGSNAPLTVDGATLEEQLATLERMILIAHRAGMQIGTHATGDATIDAVVARYLKAMRARRRRDPRHYIIHGDLTPRATLRRMARNGIGLNMNASIKFVLGRTLDEVIGPERTDYQWPYRSALDAGVRVSSSSDAPVTEPDWLQGVSSAVLRRGRFGGVAGTAERITVREALRTYTSTPAWQDRAERWKGTLQRGRVADIAILDGDVLKERPAKITDLEVTATVLGGKVVYERRNSRKAAAARASRAAADAGVERAAACLHGGRCCCTIARELAEGLA